MLLDTIKPIYYRKFFSLAWQQHDVQELMRVMFDALERKWKKTPQKDLINELYQGQMQDYVKCMQVGHVANKRSYVQE